MDGLIVRRTRAERYGREVARLVYTGSCIITVREPEGRPLGRLRRHPVQDIWEAWTALAEAWTPTDYMLAEGLSRDGGVAFILELSERGKS